MKRVSLGLVALSGLAIFASSVFAQDGADVNQASQGATFGFDTGTSVRPRTSLSYRTEALQRQSSYGYSIPNYVPHKSTARAQIEAARPFEYSFPSYLGPSFTGTDFAWGNNGSWIGHPQYLGYGYPFPAAGYFYFGR